MMVRDGGTEDIRFKNEFYHYATWATELKDELCAATLLNLLIIN